MKLYFITGNKKKFEEFKTFFPDIVMLDIELLEIQSINSEDIIKEKLKIAVKIASIKENDFAIIVEDTSLLLECLGGLPGPLIKWFLETIKIQGLYDLCKKYENYNATAKDVIGYSDSKGNINFFEGVVKGKIVSPKGDDSFGWDPIFVPEGSDMSFGEMSKNEKNEISHRRLAINKLKEFLSPEKN